MGLASQIQVYMRLSIQRAGRSFHQLVPLYSANPDGCSYFVKAL